MLPSRSASPLQPIETRHILSILRGGGAVHHLPQEAVLGGVVGRGRVAGWLRGSEGRRVLAINSWIVQKARILTPTAYIALITSAILAVFRGNFRVFLK